INLRVPGTGRQTLRMGARIAHRTLGAPVLRRWTAVSGIRLPPDGLAKDVQSDAPTAPEPEASKEKEKKKRRCGPSVVSADCGNGHEPLRTALPVARRWVSLDNDHATSRSATP